MGFNSAFKRLIIRNRRKELLTLQPGYTDLRVNVTLCDGQNISGGVKFVLINYKFTHAAERNICDDVPVASKCLL